MKMKWGKKPWKSKTFWFNLVALIVVVAKHYGYIDFQPSPDVEYWAGVLVFLINLILRFVTKEPIVF